MNNLTLNVLKIFMELDAALVEECSKKYAEKQPKLQQAKKDKEQTWKRLEQKANEQIGQGMTLSAALRL